MSTNVAGLHPEGGVELTTVTGGAPDDDSPAVLGVAESELPKDPRHLRHVLLLLLLLSSMMIFGPWLAGLR